MTSRRSWDIWRPRSECGDACRTRTLSAARRGARLDSPFARGRIAATAGIRRYRVNTALAPSSLCMHGANCGGVSVTSKQIARCRMLSRRARYRRQPAIHDSLRSPRRNCRGSRSKSRFSGPLEVVHDVGQVEVGRHGLLIESGWRRGLLLPQVATEWGWDAAMFVAQTCRRLASPGMHGQTEVRPFTGSKRKCSARRTPTRVIGDSGLLMVDG